MARFTLQVDISQAEQRIDRYQKNLTDTLVEEWQAIVIRCIEDVASRAPDPHTEFEYIQGYAGGIFTDSGGDSVGGSHTTRGLSHRNQVSQTQGHMSNLKRKNTKEGERISFIRSPGMWIKELVSMPPDSGGPNISIPEKFFIGLGVVPLLELGTRFSWQNFSGRRQENLHTSPYGMWSFFEYGKSAGQIAVHGKYKLKPYEDKPWFWTTEKHYPQLRMYGMFNQDVFREAVTEVIQSVQF